jgi:hypothetical protein
MVCSLALLTRLAMRKGTLYNGAMCLRTRDCSHPFDLSDLGSLPFKMFDAPKNLPNAVGPFAFPRLTAREGVLSHKRLRT